jgi:two-component system chemotaxis sensor kinase CheA
VHTEPAGGQTVTDDDSGLFDDPTLLLEFIAESQEHLDTAEAQLLEYEKSPTDVELINTIFRSIHSVKGAAGFFNLEQISELSHKLETILNELRSDKREGTPDIIDVLVNGTDVLKKLVDRLSSDTDAQIDRCVDGGPEEYNQVVAKLDGLLGEQPTEPAPEPTTTAEALGGALPELIDEFKTEARENLAASEQALVEFEQDRARHDLINDIFRAVHTTKGSSDYLGLSWIQQFAHLYESLLDLLRQDESLKLGDATLNVMFSSTDYLKRACEAAPDELRADAELGEQLQAELAALSPQAAPAPAPAQAAATDADSMAVFLSSSEQHLSAIQACVDKIIAGKRSRKVMEACLRAATSLKTAASFVGNQPIAEAAERSAELLEAVRSGERRSKAELTNSLGEQLDAIVAELERLKPGAEPEPAPAVESPKLEAPMTEPVEPTPGPGPDQADQQRAQAVKTMRIDQEKLDVFMNLVGELTITKNTFAHITRRVRGDGFSDEILQELESGVFSINRISDELQANVMNMRMVPVRMVFSRFPRLVRDLTRKNGKKIRLIIHGEDTGLDKGIAEDLTDPLVHIIRNCADHGIETPDVRRAAGKDETGTITLRATHQGNSIVIEIADDGGGIDPNKVKRKAIEKGIITPDEAERLPEPELVRLICRPGFSTADQVTDVSGRGVGMDVVQTNIAKLKGTVNISSEVGKGTSIRIELPLTLVIVEALLVGAGGQDFAVPLDAVDETISVTPKQIQQLQGHEAFLLRGETIGLVRLTELLHLKDKDNGQRTELPVAILSAAGERIGVIVDELYDQEEIVIKPLDQYLASIKGLGGASIMGDGRIIMILDAMELIRTVVDGTS